MIKSLAYLGVHSPDYQEWERFGPEVLGLQLAGHGADGAVRLRLDEAHHRIAIHPGVRNAVAYIGWSVQDEAGALAVIERVRAPRKPPSARWKAFTGSRTRRAFAMN